MMGDLSRPYHFYYVNGKPTVTLRFAGEPQHMYYREIGSKLIPVRSVTTILKIIDKPYLMPWAAKVMGIKLLETMPKENVGHNPLWYTEPIPWEKFEELVRQAKSAHKDIKEAAGDVGDLAHMQLEAAITFAVQNLRGVVRWQDFDFSAGNDKRVESCCWAAFSWMKNHNVRWESTEKKVYSLTYNYAGTLDGLCLADSCDDPVCCPNKFRDERSIADWKTSNQLSTSYLYQTSAYQHAELEENSGRVDARWILRLGKEDGEFEAWYATNFAQDFKAFLAALSLSEAHYNIEKRMSNEKKERTIRKKKAKMK